MLHLLVSATSRYIYSPLVHVLAKIGHYQVNFKRFSRFRRIEYDTFTVDVNILNTSYSVHLELEETWN